MSGANLDLNEDEPRCLKLWHKFQSEYYVSTLLDSELHSKQLKTRILNKKCTSAATSRESLSQRSTTAARGEGGTGAEKECIISHMHKGWSLIKLSCNPT